MKGSVLFRGLLKKGMNSKEKRANDPIKASTKAVSPIIGASLATIMSAMAMKGLLTKAQATEI